MRAVFSPCAMVRVFDTEQIRLTYVWQHTERSDCCGYHAR
jgi:hypothetical protein